MSAQVRVYCCGGAGINIGRRISSEVRENYAQLLPSFIDTSTSNLESDISEKDVYLLKPTAGTQVDGSGKRREANAEEINKQLRQILQSQKPTDFCIVLSSMGGGSGSVIAPMLTAELLSRGHAVVCIGIGSFESAITAYNTRDTMASYDAIARSTNAGLVLMFEQNGKNNTNWAGVDRNILASINALSELAAGTHKGLDGSDIANWAKFTEVTSQEPQLALLEVIPGRDGVAESYEYPISVASIYPMDCEGNAAGIVAEYSAEGYRRVASDQPEIHFVIYNNDVQELFNTLEKHVAEHEEIQRSRVSVAPLSQSVPVQTGIGGLVFTKRK